MSARLHYSTHRASRIESASNKLLRSFDRERRQIEIYYARERAKLKQRKGKDRHG